MGELPSISSPSKAFPIGKHLRVRILRVNPEKHSLICTNKRSFLKEDAPIVTSIEEVKIDDEVMGLVQDIRNGSVHFRFFNDVSGMVPVFELQRRNLKAEDLYKKGRVARVKVQRVDRMHGRLTLIPIEGEVQESCELMVRDCDDCDDDDDSQ